MGQCWAARDRSGLAPVKVVPSKLGEFCVFVQQPWSLYTGFIVFAVAFYVQIIVVSTSGLDLPIHWVSLVDPGERVVLFAGQGSQFSWPE